MKLASYILFFVFILSGCRSDFTEIKDSELSRAFILNSSPTFQGYSYLGSDESYHYFTDKWKYGADRQFKIHKTDMAVIKEEPYGQTEVRIYQFKRKDFEIELFGSIGNQTLFRRSNSTQKVNQQTESGNMGADVKLAEAEELCSKGDIDNLRKARDLCEEVLIQNPYSENGIKTLKKVYSKFGEYNEKKLQEGHIDDDLTPWYLKKSSLPITKETNE